MALEERLPAKLTRAMALIGALGATAAAISGHPAVARGIAIGVGLAIVYLIALWRFVRAYLARAQGQRVDLGARLILMGGLPGRLLMAGLVLYWVARQQPWINFWAAIGGFLSYRVLLAVHPLTRGDTGRPQPDTP